MIKLYDDQKKIVDEVFSELSSNILISSPSGSGKTVIIAEIVSRLIKSNKSVMILAHTFEIRNQIRKTLKRRGVNEEIHITGPRSAVNQYIDDRLPYEPDYIIIDEAHHSEAQSYQDFIGAHKDSIVIGLTATPMRNDLKRLSNTFDRLVLGMSVKSLIESNRLSQFVYFAPDKGKHSISTMIDSKYLDFEDITFRTGRFKNLTVRKTIYADVLRTYETHSRNEQSIIFAHSVEAAERYAKVFSDAGYSSAHLSSKLSASERSEMIKKFESGDIRVLTNYNIISEGFDVPEVANVILARPTDSLILFMQQASRAIRYKPDKVAKIFDHANNVSRHGMLDDSRAWSLDQDEIVSRTFEEYESFLLEREQQNSDNKKTFSFLKDFELSEFQKAKDDDFDKLVENALSNREVGNWEKNKLVIEELVKIQRKYAIQLSPDKSSITWVKMMIERYQLV